MDEAGDLEIIAKNLTGAPHGAERFGATALEFEYGATKWWTPEVYLSGQVTAIQSPLFTGDSWENRFRLLSGKQWINPVFYTEFENLNGADKTLLEVVSNDKKEIFAIPNDVARWERNRELQNKLILASYFKGFTLAENLIFEKTFSPEPWEFGYTVGISHPLSHKSGKCSFCADQIPGWRRGVWRPGNHGTVWAADTSHSLAPVITWPGHGTAFRLSQTFARNSDSAGSLLRSGVSYKVDDFGYGCQILQPALME
jgi:hypothetical protein